MEESKFPVVPPDYGKAAQGLSKLEEDDGAFNPTPKKSKKEEGIKDGSQ